MTKLYDDYCSKEVTDLLKEKGFDGECVGCYWDSKKTFDVNYEPLSYSDGDLRDEVILAPTHQMAMKWLREVHNIIIVIEPHSYNYMEEKTSSYDFSIWCGDNYEHPFTTDYPTFEKAVETAIKYCLINLI